MRAVLDTTLCDKICQWLAAGRCFSPDTPVSSTNNTDRHDITETVFCVRHVLCVLIYNYTDDTNNGMWSDNGNEYIPDQWYKRCSGCEYVGILGSCTGSSV
jgi:hypothetical protein